MIGILAWEAMAHQGFDSRVFIGPFETIVDKVGSQLAYQKGSDYAMLQHMTLMPPNPPSLAARTAAYNAGAGLLM